MIIQQNQGKKNPVSYFCFLTETKISVSFLTEVYVKPKKVGECSRQKHCLNSKNEKRFNYQKNSWNSSKYLFARVCKQIIFLFPSSNSISVFWKDVSKTKFLFCWWKENLRNSMKNQCLSSLNISNFFHKFGFE